LLAHLHDMNDRRLWIAYDEVLGLKLSSNPSDTNDKIEDFPEELSIFSKYKQARSLKNYQESDALRAQLKKMGWHIRDDGEESFISKYEKEL